MSAVGLMLFLAVSVAALLTALAVRTVILSRDFRIAQPWEGDLPADLPAVDAVVPARNEEAYVETTVASLLAQEYPDLRLTVVDDRSTDRTAAVLEGLALGPAGDRLRVIRGAERPPGWVGKTWAVHQGVNTTSAEWLWFVDADMRLHSRALATAMVEARASGADMVSFLPAAECRTFWQGAIATTLLQILSQLYPLSKVNDPKRPEALAAGGFVLIRREAYLAVGGHEAVRSEIVEDIRLAEKVKRSGWRLLSLPAPTLATTHMYGSLAQIVQNMRKNAYAGMNYQLHQFVVGGLVAFLLAWVPPLALIWGILARSPTLIGVGTWGILAQAALAMPGVLFFRLPVRIAFASPLGMTAYLGICALSVRDYYRGHLHWKGDRIAVEDVTPSSRESRS